MKTFWLLAYGIAVGLLGAGLVLLISTRPRGESVQLNPPPSPQPLRVHVAGAVPHPDVYELPPGSRIQDAIIAAGGLLSDGDTSTLNLAALLDDGERVNVPLRIPTSVPSEQSQESSAPAPIPAGEMVNINTADQAALETLPGIGPVTARAILDHRQNHGPFETIESIQEVSGIGPAKYDRIKDLITVTDP